ncbi:MULTISPECIES: F0F1 ATP synthase subunit epsilon [unclassified Sporosarcina]|uniref:F0F1 ATP synthase subunit epsilon n=1 Tax=unclassified Sporosarcina TaxID=2647733 RepID=UPI000C16E5A6|nr:MULTISPECIES: F0F1 ATP synthase subunit epsilon [unclassified Sporosarcina]PIC71047.1 F0F1 ATP synthase subunit epsilon [Sporosarcina sp. P16b]PID02426.1 F0F1 ATP synthase subunit epsilon [Sporosarcina sp. P2]PID15149.1 F0F1 ATP synthase subunit epsilon [Sporosarcina sp. P34]PID23903.1 F0F1 ATP synthase subunit epsilon [Sporosarcina sp. P7]
MSKIKVNIVTPDGPVVEMDANMVIAVTEAGEIGVLPGHIAMVAPLQIGALRLKTDGKTETVAVHGGFIEVRPEVVTVLAQSAELAESIDIARAKKAAEKAEQDLQNKTDALSQKLAELDLKRAINRMQVYEQRI